MNWKSNYKLPLSFIVFFILMFFLLGEQLPSLPLYLVGPAADHDNKVHMLDLAPGDALHRPIAYLIIAILNWLLFRNLAWPIAYAIGDGIAIIDQFFLIPESPSRTLFSALIISFAWAVFTLIPYFAYRWVNGKWGGKGIKNANLTLFLINLILFGFFAFQIYVLHNSYRDLYKNAQGQADLTPRLPPNTCPERMIEEKDKTTTAYLSGKTFEVAEKEQTWVEQNCPRALERP